MSLLSQKDREMVIGALELYVNTMKKEESPPEAIRSYETLLNWIRLEYFKNE